MRAARGGCDAEPSRGERADTQIWGAEGLMLARILAALVWIIANVVYSSMVRDGQRGFRRLAAFYLGWPGTFVSYLAIQPKRRVEDPELDTRYRTQLEFEEDRDLLYEIRRDRARRVSQGQAEDEGAMNEEA